MADNITELKIESQENIELLVKGTEMQNAKTGVPFQKIYVADKSGNLSTFLRFDEPLDIQEPAVCRMLVETSTYNNKPSYRVLKSELVQNADLTNYFPKAEINEKDGWVIISDYYKRIKDHGYKRLVKELLMGDARRFRIKPLTVSGIYTRKCGIMEATINLLNLAEPAIETLSLDADLVYSAAILYYMGNIDLTSDSYLTTEDDILVGENNAVIRRLIEAEIKLRNMENPVTEEILSKRQVELLQHTLTSRVEGMKSAIPEAIVLRSLDHIIRKTEEAKMLTKNVASGSIVCGYGKQKYLKV